MLRDRLGVSERWACRVAGQHRSTQRRERVRAADDQALRSQLRAFAVARPRWGYRRAHRHLVEEGWCVNRKRVQRLWREEGLRVPARTRKRRRLGGADGETIRLRATRPDELWAIDFQHDQTADGRVLRLVNVVDEFTREALVMRVERSLSAEQTVAELEALVAARGRAPAYLRCDNGPELTAHALRDWCRFAHTKTAYIEPGAPWQNPFVESFHSRVRDELLNVEQFACLAEARVLIDDWQEDYNQRRPYSALGMRAPAAFAAAWTPNTARA
jgi:putative transposase